MCTHTCTYKIGGWSEGGFFNGVGFIPLQWGICSWKWGICYWNGNLFLEMGNSPQCWASPDHPSCTIPIFFHIKDKRQLSLNLRLVPSSRCCFPQALDPTTFRAWVLRAWGRPTSRALGGESSAARRWGSSRWWNSTRWSCLGRRTTRSRRNHSNSASNNQHQTLPPSVRGYPSTHCPQR